MNISFHFSRRPFILFLLLFLIEALIAIFLDDPFIRPYVGDILVVMLVFYFIKSFINIPDLYLATGALLFAYVVEVAQYFNFITLLGLESYSIARIVLGTAYDWRDLVAYTVGAILVYMVEHKRSK